MIINSRYLLIFGLAILVLLGIGLLFFMNSRRDPRSIEEFAGAGVAGDDRDGDGLPDLLEAAYGTSSENPDTDGDGTPDGEEVDTYRDPTRPGPGDELSPERDLLGSESERSYTQQYLLSLPADLPKGQILEEARVQAFVESVAEPLLPDIRETDIHIQEEGDIQAYLAAISPATNDRLREITSSDISQAFHLHYINHSSQPLDEIARAASDNVEVLQELPVPPEAAALHRKLLAAQVALRDNLQLLQDMPDDFIGGLVGAHRIGLLGEVFVEIAEDVRALSV